MRFNRAMNVLVACACLMSAPASASWTCSGKVRDLTIDPNGNLYMGLSAVWSYKQLCSVHTDINGVAATTCKALYAHLLAAESLDRDITFWFDKDGVTTADCTPARFPAWSYLSTTGSSGWYFGPRMVD